MYIGCLFVFIVTSLCILAARLYLKLQINYQRFHSFHTVRNSDSELQSTRKISNLGNRFGIKRKRKKKKGNLKKKSSKSLYIENMDINI